MNHRGQIGIQIGILTFIPVLVIASVWFSSLSFIPVPWPDDSAFYFVAKDLFKIPPQWVMIPQAPFEPTYRIFNFNTMPLYPLLIGLGRSLGIDGSFGIKFWPLSALTLSLIALSTTLRMRGLPFFTAVIFTAAFSLDPELRWASVLLRPESLIGLFGVLLVLGLTFGFPKKLQPTRFFDPIAVLLALSAYAHFNAIHFLFPVVVGLASQPKRLVQVGLKTAFYLSPWAGLVLWHFPLFVKQMQTQWLRLTVPNHWLQSVDSAFASLFQELGSPNGWPREVLATAPLLWGLIFLAALVLVAEEHLERPFTGLRFLLQNTKHAKGYERNTEQAQISLRPAAAWIFGSLWLWHTKPEVWFMFYPHLAIACFTGIALTKFSALLTKPTLYYRPTRKSKILFGIFCTPIFWMGTVFGMTHFQQMNELSRTKSWHWPVYYDFVDCIDQKLVAHHAKLSANGKLGKGPYRVWDPTFPDVTVELSRRHPDWEFTRTNDFMNRIPEAIQHGQAVEAVVVTETLNWQEATITERAEYVPQVTSVWMNWKPYFLNQLYTTPGWKPERYVCQRGRWQAFLFF